MKRIYQLFAARDGDTVNELIELNEATGNDLIDESMVTGRAFDLICKAFQLDDDAYEDFADLRSDLDGCELVNISVEAARRVSASLQPQTDEARAERGLALLVEARELFKAADNKRTLARVRLAISSAKGARRIQTGRRVRAEIAAR